MAMIMNVYGTTGVILIASIDFKGIIKYRQLMQGNNI